MAGETGRRCEGGFEEGARQVSRPKRPAWHWEEREYRNRRLALLIELRVIRLTAGRRGRVVKHLQQQMRKLRTYRRMMEATK